MAFITQKERDTLVKKTQKSYKGRKIFFFISMALTLIWLVLILVLTFLAEAGKIGDGGGWYKDGAITPFGYAAIVIFAVIIILDIISLILMLSVVSPKTSVKTAKKLQSSAISGVKTSKKGTSVSAAAKDRMKTVDQYKKDKAEQRRKHK